MDKLAEDAVDKPTRRPAAAFQALFLNARFPRTEATLLSLHATGGTLRLKKQNGKETKSDSKYGSWEQPHSRWDQHY